MTIGNKGMTDHLGSTGTLIFPNLARSLSLIVQHPRHQLKPSSGRIRRDGHEAHQTNCIMTGERCEMSRFFLPPSLLLSHVQKNLSSRWSLVALTTSDPEMEMVVAGTLLDHLTGEGRKTTYPHLNLQIQQPARWMEEEILSVQTELNNPTTAGERGSLTDQPRITLTDKGMVGHQTLTRGEEAQGRPKKWG